jgi:hypothetical protein
MQYKVIKIMDDYCNALVRFGLCQRNRKDEAGDLSREESGSQLAFGYSR